MSIVFNILEDGENAKTEKPRGIQCSPILSAEEFAKYERYKVAQEKLAEQRAKDHARQRKEQMLKLLDGEDLTGIDIDTEEGTFL